MDEVDKKQQESIESLYAKNAQQDEKDLLHDVRDKLHDQQINYLVWAIYALGVYIGLFTLFIGFLVIMIKK